MAIAIAAQHNWPIIFLAQVWGAGKNRRMCLNAGYPNAPLALPHSVRCR
ncbi:hypothetical protein [Pandoraea sp. SD6-2]|nr:hypothetical protein [Pandoraea sp. SD6-2]